MEALSPAQPLPHNHQIGGVMSTPESQPAPENAHHSSQTLSAGQKPTFLYKCLLNQHVQKLKKPPPIYQTQNEGSEHLPWFRTTVWVDGVSYTSSNKFHQRKMSEADASRVAYNAVTQQAKTDALHFIQQEKIFCKSIIVEFAAKKNLGKPVYETSQTTQVEESAHVFRSYLHFNGVTYPGDGAKSKKEAEQLVARSVVLQYLESEYGADMADIVYCKLRQYFEMNKAQEINTMAKSSAAPESSLVQDTMVAATFQSSGAQLSVEPITPAAPIVIQPPTQQVSTELVNPTVSLVSQPPTPHTSTKPIHPEVPAVTQQPSAQVTVDPIEPVAAESLVSTAVPSTVVANSCTPVVSTTTTVEVPETTNVSLQPKPEASPAQALEFIPLVDQASDKKRRRTQKKNARKKKRANAQIPVIPATIQVQPFSPSMNSSSSV
ncbi:putative double-stranded RNA-binding domain-containing protein [Helianthus annuus]|nr:putative double-stranded RNA-binding domain-containing protein [Helianthus annuus]